MIYIYIYIGYIGISQRKRWTHTPPARVGISRSDNVICHRLLEYLPSTPTLLQINFFRNSFNWYSAADTFYDWPIFFFDNYSSIPISLFLSKKPTKKVCCRNLCLYLLIFILSPFLLVCNSMIGLFVFPQTERKEIRGAFLSHKRTIHFRLSHATTRIQQINKYTNIKICK